MKIYYLVTLLIILVSCQNIKKQAPNTQQKYTANFDLDLNYLLYLPNNYNEDNTEGFPTILFLHGAGERGDSLELVKKWGPPKIAEEKGLPFIIISPQCPKNEYWTTMGHSTKLLLDNIIANYNVDTNRIYLTGLSMGGYGTFTISQIYPEYFAAIAPVCGGGIPSLARKSKDLPTWVFHGDQDKVVPLESSIIMVDELKKLDANVKFTIFEGVDHFSWIPAYNETNIFDWFLEHKKE